MNKYVIGVDFGTDSVRTLIVDSENGDTVASSVVNYPRWKKRLYCNEEANQFRQHPLDYLESMEKCIKDTVAQVGPEVYMQIASLGVDCTSSTPAPVNKEGTPLALLEEFKDNPNAMFWLWKDHTSIEEANEVDKAFREADIDYTTYQGTHSSERYWAKVLHGGRIDPRVKEESYSWVEHCDWIVGLLTNKLNPDTMYRCRCAAGHKAYWNPEFDGLPSLNVLNSIDPYLASMGTHFNANPLPSTEVVGTITKEWAYKLGINDSCIIGGSIIDAHSGGVGAGIKPNTFVKVIGTSCCDMVICKKEDIHTDLRTFTSSATDSIVPGYIGLESGQSAFGDLYSWFRKLLMWPIEYYAENSSYVTNKKAFIKECEDSMLEDLGNEAGLIDEEEGLIVLDWLNGRRYPNNNEQIKGGMYGLTLSTDTVHLYKAIMLSTVQGSRSIFESMTQAGVKIDQVITVGGIAKKSPLCMQMLADNLKVPIKVCKTQQACALGSAMNAAVAAGIYKDLDEAREHMESGFERTYKPNPTKFDLYDRLYNEYLKIGNNIEKDL